MKALERIAKALAGGLIAGYAVYQIATGAESPGGVGIVFDEWVGIVATTLTSGFAVWAIPNASEQSPSA